MSGFSKRNFQQYLPNREQLQILRASGQKKLRSASATLISNVRRAGGAPELRTLVARLRTTRLSAPEVRRWASLGLVFAGIALLLYVSSQYALMYAEQRKLEHEWAEQNAVAPLSQHAQQNTPAVVDDGLTRVSIPKINLDAIVVEGTGHRQLLLGPGHMKDTPMPGDIGNSVITGHRDTFFRRIYELKKGDTIEVRRRGRLYTYEVTGKKIVKPEDLSVLEQGNDHRLTLITCYPTYYIGPAPDRLVVFAGLVNTPAAAQVVHAAATTKAGK